MREDSQSHGSVEDLKKKGKKELSTNRSKKKLSYGNIGSSDKCWKEIEIKPVVKRKLKEIAQAKTNQNQENKTFQLIILLQRVIMRANGAPNMKLVRRIVKKKSLNQNKQKIKKKRKKSKSLQSKKTLTLMSLIENRSLRKLFLLKTYFYVSTGVE